MKQHKALFYLAIMLFALSTLTACDVGGGGRGEADELNLFEIHRMPE